MANLFYIAAFLFAQLEHLDTIQQKRKQIWEHYYNSLQNLEKEGFIKLPKIPNYATNNGHMFYIVWGNQCCYCNGINAIGV